MTPYEQGRAAYWRDDTFCPYKDSTWQSRDWHKGWYEAEEEDDDFYWFGW